MTFFINKEKTVFLACDTFEKFHLFLTTYEINKFDEYGNTILHYYLKNTKAFKLDPEKVILEMYSRGVDVNAQSTKGSFRHIPLNLAIDDDLKPIFDLLLKLGANVNLKMAHGNTLLSNTMMKLSVDHGYFIQKLISNGADVYLKNDYGISPISLAYTIANRDFKQYFKQFEYTPEQG